MSSLRTLPRQAGDVPLGVLSLELLPEHLRVLKRRNIPARAGDDLHGVPVSVGNDRPERVRVVLVGDTIEVNGGARVWHSPFPGVSALSLRREPDHPAKFAHDNGTITRLSRIDRNRAYNSFRSAGAWTPHQSGLTRSPPKFTASQSAVVSSDQRATEALPIAPPAILAGPPSEKPSLSGALQFAQPHSFPQARECCASAGGSSAVAVGASRFDKRGGVL
jgi:hypothetical protein